MRSFPSSIILARQLLADEQAWLWFVELRRRSDGFFYRLVESQRKVTANGKLWIPTSLKVGVPAESEDGSIAELTVSLPNVGQMAIAELEAGEVQGQPLTVWAQHESTFATFTTSLRWTARVLKATASEGAVVLSAGHPSQLQRLPRRVFDQRVAPIFATRSGGGVP